MSLLCSPSPRSESNYKDTSLYGHRPRHHICAPESKTYNHQIAEERNSHAHGHALCCLIHEPHQGGENRSADDGHDNQRSTLFCVWTEIHNAESEDGWVHQ